MLGLCRITSREVIECYTVILKNKQLTVLTLTYVESDDNTIFAS